MHVSVSAQSSSIGMSYFVRGHWTDSPQATWETANNGSDEPVSMTVGVGWRLIDKLTRKDVFQSGLDITAGLSHIF